jgi:hypothetical protein
MLSLPAGVDAARYARRKAVTEAIEADFNAKHPDSTVKAWNAAWNQAHDIALSGKAAKAFDLTGVTMLPGGATARAGDISALTLAQQLVLNGIPYVSLGIGGNDTHSNNTKGVTMNWGDTIDPAVSQMAKNLKAAGKRVLVVMGGDFGRTPASVAPNASGVRRDGRDHWPSGFSWALLSINQPAFKTTAVGDTGPDGVWTHTSSTPLVDLIYPGVLGGLLYRAMGYPIGTAASWNVPIATGATACPVDTTMATSTARGNTTWLMSQFGLA